MSSRFPTTPRSKGGSDQDYANDRPYNRRQGTNSAPPFIGALPIRSHDRSTQTGIRLPGIDEICYESPSGSMIEDYSDNSPCPKTVTSAKRDPDDTETESDQEAERDQETGEEENRPCEFSSPCRMDPSPDGIHYRKVVSHVFGRNKASTKLFPDDIWVFYCRKHYQRARYRAEQWPFTQCDLLLESLLRMQNWGGVESFELTLRRREFLRVEEEVIKNSPQTEPSDRAKHDKRCQKTKDSGRLASGRKQPTPVLAPVPSWMQAYVGKGKTFEEIRGIIVKARDYMRHISDLQKQAKQGKGGSSTPSTSKAKQAMTPEKPSMGSMVRFPDIEILPTFKPWVYAEAQKKREALRQGAGHDANHRLSGQASSNVSSLPSSSPSRPSRPRKNKR